MVAAMARTIARKLAPHWLDCAEALRVIVVCGCAYALIAAGHALPIISF
jgi:hypothetical protein